MTCYSLLPGIVLMHCDLHMSQYVSDLELRTEMFSIDHCCEGKMECHMITGAICYLDAGCVIVHAADGFTPEFLCPTNHYHGLTLTFFLDEAQESLNKQFAGVNIDLRRLRDKFCKGRLPAVLPKGELPDPLFAPLYEAPENDLRGGTNGVQLLRVLELLICLDRLDISAAGERRYFYKTQVEKVRAIERHMVEHLNAPHTIDGLSERFDFPRTSMKLCFKSVFGSSIHAYLRARRMSEAATMLRETSDRVADIAAAVGYENTSKFAEAFRACMGKAPNEYRKALVGLQAAINVKEGEAHV
jgi:AraC-like DNA-binding protein